MGKDFCPNILRPLLENFDRSNCNDGSRELGPIVHNPHRKKLPSPPAVARTFVLLVEVPSKAASSGREEKQARINIQETREYLECGNQADP